MKQIERKPDANKPQSFEEINAYQKKPVKQQIITLILFIGHFILHSIFLPRAIIVIDNHILYFLWIFFYLWIFVVSYNYCHITCHDPADTLLFDPDEAKTLERKRDQYNFRHNAEFDDISNPYRVKWCKICKKLVKIKSYHCMRCERCCQNFDHHCKYLNSCIGGKNYLHFFSLLLTTTFYLLLAEGHCIWIFIECQTQQNVENAAISRWAVLSILILGCLLMILVDSLLVFHIYISCWRRMSTIEYLYRITPSNKSSSEQNNFSAEKIVK